MSLFVLVLLFGSVVCLDNGAASTPPMGWNPYNAFLCDTTEDQYRTAANALVRLGLKDLGYEYMNMDCGWQAKSRTSSGTFMWDTERIPSGIPTLSEYVHGLGLKFGLYSDAGYFSCDNSNGAEHRIGSLNHETSDAKTFTEWGADYLKYDNCFAMSPNTFSDFNAPLSLEENHYETMRDALSAAHSSMVYSICEWGVDDPGRWAGNVGNSWRTSDDIGPPPSFESFHRILNQVVPITSFAKPGAWNDLDLFEIGNPGLTAAEWKMQFAFWSAAKSPMLISTDLGAISAEALEILKNERIVAVNQDPLGASIAFKRRYTDDNDVWAGPLHDGSMVVVIVNWKDVPQTLTFNLFDVGVASADLTDLWTGVDVGTVHASHTASVEAHGALIYKLTNTVRAVSPQFTTYLASATTNVLTGGAATRTLSDLSTVVGRIGFGGTLTITDVEGGTNGGTKLVTLSYVNADYTFFNSECSNCRRVEVSVNGGAPVVVEMPLSGQSWDIKFDGYLLDLDGFVPGPHNSVTFKNPSAWAPDMYSFGVEV